MGSGSCASCGSNGSLEYDVSVAALVCTSCGTVSTESASLGFEVLGRVLEEEGVEAGRAYLHAGGTTFVGSAGSLAVAGSDGARQKYHDARRAEVEIFIRQLLSHFELPGLVSRAKGIFYAAKVKKDFHWGVKSRLVAAASCYVAARERQTSVRLLDLAAIADLAYPKLARAQNALKSLLGLKTVEIDPVVFLDRILTHLAQLFAQSAPKLSGSGSRQKWNEANLSFARSISFAKVREVSTSLLTLTDRIALFAGRSPEQVACAAVEVGMEAVARRKMPAQRDFQDEMAHLLAVKTFTVGERYREMSKALEKWTKDVPWLKADEPAKKLKIKRAGGFENWEMAIAFTLAAEVRKDGPKREIGIALARGDDQADSDDGSPFLEDPLLDSNATVTLPTPAGSSPLAKQQSQQQHLSPSLETPVSLSATLDARAKNGKRPAEYMRSKPSVFKRARTIDTAAGALRITLSPESEDVSDFPRTPPGSSALQTDPAPRVFLPHEPEAVEIRRLLLAGNDPEAVLVKRASEQSSLGRLQRILFTTKEEDIDDEELFGPGELEAFLREPHEIARLEQTGKFRDIPNSDPTLVNSPPSREKPRERKARSESFDPFVPRTKVTQEARDRLAALFAEEEGEEKNEVGMDVELLETLGDLVADSGEDDDEEG